MTVQLIFEEMPHPPSPRPHSADSPARWVRRKEARPGEILEAALTLFVEKGFVATKMEDIARKAGVTKGTPYLYFPNKEEIFKAVVREAMLPNLERAEQLSRAHTGDAFQLIEQVLVTWWEGVCLTQLCGICKLVIAEAGNFPELAQFFFHEVVERGQKLIEDAIQYGVDRGDFRQLDVHNTMRVLFAPALMSMIWEHSLGKCEQQPVDKERFFACYLEFLRHGLRAAAGLEQDRASAAETNKYTNQEEHRHAES